MLRENFSNRLKHALRTKNGDEVSTLRLIIATLKDRDIAARGKGNPNGIPEEEILGMLQGMIKQRRESITLYEQGNRPELVAKEQKEIDIISGFLPQQMDEAAMTAAITTVVAELGATTIKDMGRAMATLKERHAGEMDFAKASAILKAKLSG
ncbi:MAG: GatB/YqeY domain-containing protein [Alphaproteobacteria bacterium]